jgi:arsenate reductase
MKTVLFVCVENACRSHMAEGLFNQLASGKTKAMSAGTRPTERVNPSAVKVMKEIGIDISKQRPKLLTQEMIRDADKVILMGCGAEECPLIPRDFEDWDIEDPSGKPLQTFREVRDEIKRRVERLIGEME